jgi:hypothetical protein
LKYVLKEKPQSLRDAASSTAETGKVQNELATHWWDRKKSLKEDNSVTKGHGSQFQATPTIQVSNH